MDETIPKRLYAALEASCHSCSSNMIALSGGLDSSIISYLLKPKKPMAVAVIAEDFVSADLTYSQMISRQMQLPLSIYNVTTIEILEAVEQTIKILENFNDIEIRNSVVMYLAIKWAKQNSDERSIITGDGADELFAGYNFLIHKSEAELEHELERICSIMHFPTQKIGKALGVDVESPFLDASVMEIAKTIPANLKVGKHDAKRHGKWILRKTFEKYIPPQIAWREKSSMQDGSGTAGLTGLFDSIVSGDAFAEKKSAIKKQDGIIIKSAESMHYYNIYKKLFGSFDCRNADNVCPFCRYMVEKNSKFCRMCGAFPI